jgi:hypothetical protein
MILRLAAPWALLVVVCVTAGLLASRGPIFTIHGDLSAALRPGIEDPIDVTVSNPNDYPIRVDSVWVSISRVTAGTAGGTTGCGTGDFAVRQSSAAIQLVVPANSRARLSDLNIPRSGWPRLRMVASPIRSQDGCKGARLTLSYAAVGSLWTL